MAHISPVCFLVMLPFLALVDLIVNDSILTLYKTTSPPSEKRTKVVVEMGHLIA